MAVADRFSSLYRFQCPAGMLKSENIRWTPLVIPCFAGVILLLGGLAQLGERLLCKQEVSGSSPLISTILGR